MDPRYTKDNITHIFSLKHELWQETELAALKARVELGLISQKTYSRIEFLLKENPISFEVIARIEEKVRHDLNAFIEERKFRLPPRLAKYLHEGLTSYDTEEPAFARMLMLACKKVNFALETLIELAAKEAVRHRYLIMMFRTHGQEGKLQTHGKRCLTWYMQLKLAREQLLEAMEKLNYSKMSGAGGNYGDFTPVMEEKALAILGLKPFYGATQIMPREIYAPVAEALTQIVGTICKISDDIRLGSRSGNQIYQEPFKKSQMGSSAMPHKKNTIQTEQMEGMFRMAKGYLLMIMDNIKTWEERAIEQSCVERVAWPDLFHVSLHAIETITKVISGMKIFPDHMYQEIINSRGCYASDEAKNFLGKKLLKYGCSTEAYRIVQLAAENAHDPGLELRKIRETLPKSLKEAEGLLKKTGEECAMVISIQEIIENNALRYSKDLEADKDKIEAWNKALKQLFRSTRTRREWRRLFKPSYLLRHEKELFQQILGT